MADSKQPISSSIEEFADAVTTHNVHTVELAIADTQGHLRGKRIPAKRFLGSVHSEGANIADAVFVFDMQNDLPENEFINMDSGYLDCHLQPDMSTGRILTHRPGYALVFADAVTPQGQLHPLSPRSVLAKQIERCRSSGIEPVVATEMEFYLCRPDRTPVQNHIQYSSLTDGLEVETVLHEMREALMGAGIEIESSNAEYGPGQVEINTAPTDAMTAADNTVLYKSIVKQIAVQHGMRATFMPKPWAEQSGSGMHLHTSLNQNGTNAFSDAKHGEPNELMRHWIGGLMEHAPALSLLGTPSVNGPKRIRPYTFAPTHATWGLDNRTVLARCIVEPGSPANRVEYRYPGADANPHLIVAGLLAAGADGVEQKRDPGPVSTGDLYTNPGDATVLPADLPSAIEAFGGSQLAAQLGDEFARSYASISTAEVALGAEHSKDADEVNDWERERYMDHS